MERRLVEASERHSDRNQLARELERWTGDVEKLQQSIARIEKDISQRLEEAGVVEPTVKRGIQVALKLATEKKLLEKAQSRLRELEQANERLNATPESLEKVDQQVRNTETRISAMLEDASIDKTLTLDEGIRQFVRAHEAASKYRQVLEKRNAVTTARNEKGL